MGQKVALITGIGGQDGSYLAEFLLEKGYKVRGIIRRSSLPNTGRIEHLIKKYQDFKALDNDSAPFLVKYADLMDGNSLREIIEKFKPDEIYNLGAQSHVGISFQTPESTFQFNTLGPLRILEAIRQSKLKCKYYQASSSEMFGSSPPPQDESTPMLPQSPYGISKLAAYHLTRLYRDAYGIFACSGILFNHESPRRGHNFVTKKITQELARIIVGEIDKISLGNLDAKRDWGFSKEYIKAMWEILQQPEPEDYVISTDETHTVREFLQEVFSIVGLNYEDFLETNDFYKRPAEVPALLGDSSKARKILGWDPKVKFKELVKMMVVSDIKKKLEETGNISVTSDVEKNEDYYLEKAKEVFAKVKVSKNN